MNTPFLIKNLLPIATKAGAAILDIYQSAADFEVTTKNNHSPLTQADQAANQIICQELEKLQPDIPIISEENKQVPYEVRKNYNDFWLVDPLDGTKEFINRNGEFTVNIALIRDHQPILGVVYAPVLDHLYWAAREAGAWLVQSKKQQRLQTTPFQLTDRGLTVVCSRSHLNDHTQQYIADLQQPQMVSVGSSLKFLLLAKGEAQLYPRLAPTMEWGHSRSPDHRRRSRR